MKDGQNSQYGGQSPNFVSIFDPQSKGIGIMAGCDVGIHLGKGGGRRKEAEEGGGRIGEGGVKDGLRRVGEGEGGVLFSSEGRGR